MKSSQFNILIEYPRTGEIILFNTLYASFIVCSRSEVPLVKQLLENPNANVTNEVKIIKSHLMEGKYIISDDVNEIEIVKNRKIRGMGDSNRLDVIIMPNMTCNFACPYCYESHIPSSFMNDETEESIKTWLKNKIPKFKVLLLQWFGGEPLLSYKRIISISSFVKGVCEKCNVGYMPNITTNGYLLNESRIKEIISIGIFNFQITVDGPPEIHNRTRILKSGGDSFCKIFENICFLVRADKRVRISLRVNFNQNNIHSIPELLKIFPIGVRSSLRIVYEPIFGSKCISATDNIPGVEISRKLIAYYQLAQQMGYDVILGSVGTGKLVYCYAERGNQFIFDYKSDVFKCTGHSSFTPEERFGYLNSNGKLILNEKCDKWFEMDLFDKKCYSCKFLPICMGGCRKMRQQYGDTGSFCTLVPTNASFALKSVAFKNFDAILQRYYNQIPNGSSYVKYKRKGGAIL